MKTIQVHLGKRSYPIHVKSGLLKDVPDLLAEANHGQKWIIISQYGLMELFGFELMANLKEQSFNIDYISIPMGEAAKSMKEFSNVNMSDFVQGLQESERIRNSQKPIKNI